MVLSPQNENDTKRLEVCANLNKFLFDYQREGVNFLYSAYRRRTGAILGDDMGRGKTIQVIAFLSAILGKLGDRREKDAWKALLHERRERFYEGGGALGNIQEFRSYYGDDIKYGRKKPAAPEAVKRRHEKEEALRKVLIPYYLRREKEINPTFQEVSNFKEVRAIGTTTCGKMIVLEKLLTATKYCRLDGNTKVEDRLQMVNEFNNPDSNTTVFLISTKAGGVGLNLLFDPSWNPAQDCQAQDCQAQDRAYRIGQTKDVQVYRPITLGTIEEMIYVRQIYKQQLSDTTLKGSKAP
ncbi:hypothetical protein BBJ29_002433 [Phytophthora kernoviae]|uniref:Helicase C-terminal domain-containing protein n=2 Tax=Phytophthora kernoviae TaxID=325452 RepID=A0A3R7H2M0_9STRA|nr:hypothetical protein BBJ29_002433 [Phytophthora kernoviae]